MDPFSALINFGAIEIICDTPGGGGEVLRQCHQKSHGNRIVLFECNPRD